MFKHSRCIIAAGALCLSAPLSAQTVINFDNLNNGDVVTNQYAGVTFSSTAGNVNYITAQSGYNGSKPNFICTGPVRSSINCAAPTFIDWVSAVTGVKISGLGINDVGKVAEAHLFNGATNLGTFNIMGNAQGLDPLVLDFTGYGAITRLELTNITDAAGIGWDDLTYTANGVTTTPEPSSFLLVAAGVAALAIARRKRQA